MISPFTALAVRTLRLDTRAYRTHLMRCGLGGLVLLVVMSTTSGFSRLGAPGLYMLTMLAYSGAIFLTLVSITLFSSVITEEKEEQTIGLLRMAGLRPLAIILAKVGARLWDLLMIGAAILPFTMLCVTLGGVSLTQVLATMAAIAGHLVFLAGLGLLLSVLRPTATSASSLMLLTLVVVQLGPLLLLGVPVVRVIASHSIWFQLSYILSTGYPGGILTLGLAINLGLGAGLAAIAWALFDRFVRDEEPGGQGRAMRVRGGRRTAWFPYRRSRPGLAALVAKDMHFFCGGRFMMVLKPLMVLTLAGLYLGLLWYFQRHNVTIGAELIGDTLLVITLFWLPMELAIHLSRLFSQEVEQQTLSSLCLLPYTTATIVATKIWTAVFALTPVALITAIAFALAAEDVAQALRHDAWVALVVSGSSTLLFLSATAFFALTIRRGALATAFGMVLAWMAVFGIVEGAAGFGNGVPIAIGNSLLTVAAAVIFTANLPGRFAARAAQ